jgi:uncharacterized RDD family membrane protein YckC
VGPIPLEGSIDHNRGVVDNDPYQPPATELRAPAHFGPEGEVLASRESRLGASIIDSIIIMAIVLPMQWKMGMFENPEANTALTTVAWGGGGFVLTLLIQGYFLATRAQSIGKMALNIKIVTLDGKNANLQRILLLRMLPVTLVTVIPMVGSVLSLVNTLFIFREDQRCIHDHIAGTRVVKA